MNDIKLQGLNAEGNEKGFSLNDFKGQRVILYFYPKDNTSGCTQEACDFRDNINRLTSYATVIGVSPDSIKSHKSFKEKQSLQKIPYVLYTGKEIYVNDHYYYPWNINEKASYCSYLLRYKLFKDDKEKTSFYKEGISVAVGDIPFDFK